MPKTNTDISGGEVRLNLADLQRTALCAVGSLRNQINKISDEIMDETKKSFFPAEKREYMSIKLKTDNLLQCAKNLEIVGRTFDAVFAADSRDEVVVVKG